MITSDSKDGSNQLSEDGGEDGAQNNGNPKASKGQSNGSQGLETKTLVWRITTRKLESIKPEWIYAQVSVAMETPYRIQFEGEAMDGGFALDDITYYEGSCRSKLVNNLVHNRTRERERDRQRCSAYEKSKSNRINNPNPIISCLET